MIIQQILVGTLFISALIFLIKRGMDNIKAKDCKSGCGPACNKIKEIVKN